MGAIRGHRHYRKDLPTYRPLDEITLTWDGRYPPPTAQLLTEAGLKIREARASAKLKGGEKFVVFLDRVDAGCLQYECGAIRHKASEA